jgi:hypothetical protein
MWGFEMGTGDKSGDEVKKLSRLEREREKLRVAQANIDKILAVEGAKNRKLETRDKILLGVMFQGLIVDGKVSTELFEGAIQKYLKSDKDRQRCAAYFDLHRPQADLG